MENIMIYQERIQKIKNNIIKFGIILFEMLFGKLDIPILEGKNEKM